MRRRTLSPWLIRSSTVALGVALVAVGASAQTTFTASGFDGARATLQAGDAFRAADNASLGTTTIAINSSQAVLDWAPRVDPVGPGITTFQQAGQTVTFTSTSGGDFAVLNRILTVDPQKSVQLNGTVLGRIGSLAPTTGGSIYFYTPQGLIIGSTGVIDAGRIGLSTALPTYNPSTGDFIVGNAVTYQTALTNSQVVIQNGASLTAPVDGSSYVAVFAPFITQNGTINVNGSAALVAASAGTLTWNNGLFNIQVTEGSDGNLSTNTIDHGGTTGGTTVSGGATDLHRVYMVAVPKNNAVTTLIQAGSHLGFDIAGAADVSGNAVILTSGYDIANDGATATSATTGGNAAHVTVLNSTVTSKLAVTARDNAVVSAVNGTTALASNVSVQGASVADFYAQGASSALTVGGNLSLVTTYDGTNSSAIVGTARIRALNSGTVGVTGNVSITANQFINGTAFTGGTAEVYASNNGAVNVGGNLQMSASGIGSIFLDRPNGTGGTVLIHALNGNAAINVTGTTTAFAAGIGAASSGLANGGTGTAGQILLDASTGADNVMTFTGNAAFNATAVGGNSTSGFGGGAVGSPSPASPNVDMTVGAGGSYVFGGNLSVNAGASSGTGGLGSSTAQAGVVRVTTTAANASFSVAGTTSITANAASGGGTGANGTGGTATGGFIALTALDGTLTLTGTSSLRANGTGGANASAHDGFGGTVQLSAGTNTGRLRLIGDVIARAVGTGGNAGSSGQGGAGTGGTVGVDSEGNGQIIFSGIADLNASGIGGDASFQGAVGGTGYGGGASNGGTGVLIQAGTGGQVTFNDQLIAGADGTGGATPAPDAGLVAGGDGFGGHTQIAANSSGIVKLARGGNLFATGTGGSTFGSGAQTQGGQGQGGNTETLIGTGGTLVLGGVSAPSTYTFHLDASGIGGLSNSDGAGGNGLGGTASLISDFGSTVTLNPAVTALEIFADGTGGAGALSGNGGLGQGGTALLQQNGGTMTLNAPVSLEANGSGGLGGTTTSARGGDGVGGFVSVQNQSGNVLTFSSPVTPAPTVLSLSSIGTGGGGRAGGGSGGNGTGTSASLHALSGSIAVHGSVNISAGGHGGDAQASGATGGSGSGGVAEIVADGSSQIDIDAQAILSATGQGGFTIGSANYGTLAGGAGTGGERVSIEANDDSTINIGFAASILADAQGGNVDGTSGPVTGGTAHGGLARMIVGTNDGSGQINIGTGSSVTPFFTTMDAGAIGGHATAGTGDGGAATGGIATIESGSNLGSITINNPTTFVSVSADGLGGIGTGTGIGGEGIGGTAKLVFIGGAANINAPGQWSANGSGGDASGNAGRGTGGRAYFLARDGGFIGFSGPAALSGQLAALRAGGFGGTSGGGLGGNGAGGVTQLEALSGGTISIQGNALLFSSAGGGDGGTAGQGDATHSITSDPSVFVHSQGGSILVFGNLGAEADGTGGTGLGVGGTGGAGLAGSVRFSAEAVAAGPSLIQVSSGLTVNARGLGGAGSGGGLSSDPLAGGDGGAAVGGNVVLKGQAGTDSTDPDNGKLSLNSATITITATGGAGGVGQSNSINSGAGANGGNGGDATIGHVLLGADSVAGSGNTGGAFFGGNVIVDATARGGNGGQGGAGGPGDPGDPGDPTAIPPIPPRPPGTLFPFGIPGNGGNGGDALLPANYVPSSIIAQGATVSGGFYQLTFDLLGGDGALNGNSSLLSAGGSSTTAGFNLAVSARAVTGERGNFNAFGLNVSASAFSGNGGFFAGNLFGLAPGISIDHGDAAVSFLSIFSSGSTDLNSQATGITITNGTYQSQQTYVQVSGTLTPDLQSGSFSGGDVSFFADQITRPASLPASLPTWNATNLTLGATNVDFYGNVHATGSITANAFGSMTLGALTADTGNIALTATNSAIDTGALSAGNAVILSSGDTITTPSIQAGNYVRGNATDSIVITGPVTAGATGGPTGNATSIQLFADVQLRTGALTATKGVTVGSGALPLTVGAISSGGDVLVLGTGNVTLSSVTGASDPSRYVYIADYSMKALGGSALSFNPSAIFAAAPTSIIGNVSVASPITGGNIVVGATGTIGLGNLQGAGRIDLRSTGALGGVTVGTVRSGIGFYAQSLRQVQTGAIDAGDFVFIDAGDIVVNGAVTAGIVNPYGGSFANPFVYLFSQTGVQAQDITATSGIAVRAQNGAITLGALDTLADAAILGNGAVTLGSVRANNRVLFGSQSHFSVLSPSDLHPTSNPNLTAYFLDNVLNIAAPALNGSVTVNGPVTGGGYIHAATTGAIGMGAVTGGGDVNLLSQGSSLTTGAITSTGSTVALRGGDLTAGNISAAGLIQISPFGTAVLGDVTTTDSLNMVSVVNSISVGNSISIGNIRVGKGVGIGPLAGVSIIANLTTGSINAGDYVAIEASNVVIGGGVTTGIVNRYAGPFSTYLVVLVGYDNLSIDGDVVSSAEVQLFSGGAITTKSVTAAGNAIFFANTGATVVGSLSSGVGRKSYFTNISALPSDFQAVLPNIPNSDGSFFYDFTALINNTAPVAITGNIGVSGPVSGGDLLFATTGSATLGNVNVTGLVDGRAGTLTAGNVSATGDVTLGSSGALTVGNVTAGGILALSGLSTILTGDLTAGSTLDLSNATGALTTGNLSSPDDIIINRSNAFTSGSITTGGNLQLFVSQSASTGALSANGSIDAASDADLTIGGPARSGLGTVTGSTNEIRFGATGNLTTSDIRSPARVLLLAQNGLISTGTINVGTDLLVLGHNGVTLRNITQGGGATYIADTSMYALGDSTDAPPAFALSTLNVTPILTASLTAMAGPLNILGENTVNAIQFNTTGAVTLGDVTSNSLLIGQGGSINGAHLSGQSLLRLFATSDIGFTSATGQIVAIAGGGNVSAGTVAASNLAALFAQNGLLTLNNTVSAPQIRLASADIAIGANGGLEGNNSAQATIISLSASGTGIGDGVTGTGYLLDNAEFGRLRHLGSLRIVATDSQTAPIAMTIGNVDITGPDAGSTIDSQGGAVIFASGTGEGLSLFGTSNFSPSGTIRVTGSIKATGYKLTNGIVFSADTFELDATTGLVEILGTGTNLGGYTEFDTLHVHIAQPSILQKLAANPLYADRATDINTPLTTPRPDGVVRSADIITERPVGILVQNTGTAALPAGFLSISDGPLTRESVPQIGSIDFIVNGQLFNANAGRLLTGAQVHDFLIDDENRPFFRAGSTINGCLVSQVSCGGDTPNILQSDGFTFAPPEPGITEPGTPTDEPQTEEERREQEAAAEKASRAPIVPPAPLINTTPLSPPSEIDEPISGSGNPALVGAGIQDVAIGKGNQ